MMLNGLMLLVAATALMVRGFKVCGALLGLLGLVLLVLGRPGPGVVKGRKP
jgi:hypothetical protein